MSDQTERRPITDPAWYLDRRPDDIPEADWQQIILGSTFARVVAEVRDGPDPDGERADADLDEAGELQEGLRKYGYVIVRSEP